MSHGRQECLVASEDRMWKSLQKSQHEVELSSVQIKEFAQSFVADLDATNADVRNFIGKTAHYSNDIAQRVTNVEFDQNQTLNTPATLDSRWEDSGKAPPERTRRRSTGNTWDVTEEERKKNSPSSGSAPTWCYRGYDWW